MSNKFLRKMTYGMYFRFLVTLPLYGVQHGNYAVEIIQMTLDT